MDLPDPAGAERGRVVAAPAAQLTVEPIEGDRVELGSRSLPRAGLSLVSTMVR